MILKEGKYQDGFTLIEVIIAIFVLMIGILGAIVMQEASIKGNSTAEHVTESANSASDQLEILMAMDYDDGDLTDAQNDGEAGHGEAGLNNTDAAGSPPDGGPVVQDDLTLYWNVAEDYPIFGTKTIRVIVRRTDRGVDKDVVLDFMKMEPI